MKKTLLCLTFCQALLLPIAGMAGYTTSQGNQGYHTSLEDQNQGYRTSGSSSPLQNQDQFSISFNVADGYGTFSTGPNDSYYVSAHFNDRHRNRPLWARISPGLPLPTNGLIGGGENNTPINYLVCRANYRGGQHPGKVVAGKCNISWGGEEIVLSNYEVLIDNHRYVWVPGNNGYAPRNAIVGGFENGHPLFICQAFYRNGAHVGKIVGRNCNFGWGGREISLPNYNVLAW